MLLGRGTDYSWSATSSGQDIIDTFAVPLCETGRQRPGQEQPALPLPRQLQGDGDPRARELLGPSVGDQTPPGTITLRAERTALGLVTGRATVKGKPVAFTQLRSTYVHEAESAIGFRDFNNPAKMRNPKAFQKAAHKIGFTFNWLYANDKDTAYFNSGDNPLRAKRVAPDFPVSAKMEWQGFDPVNNESKLTAAKNHPQSVNQSYKTSWNNKQGRGYRAADDTWSYGSAYRSITLDQRVKPQIKGKKKISLIELVQAMEGAATVDLRGITALPYALKVMGRSSDPLVNAALADLRAWVKAGAHRRDGDRSGSYEHTDAIRVMDAWWESWMRGEFEARLGKPLFDKVAGMNTIDDDPNHHQGSAYNGGFYSYANKDLRTLLEKQKRNKQAKKLKKINKKRVKAGKQKLKVKIKNPVRGKYSTIYCGKGRIKDCRSMLLGTLKASLTKNPYAAEPAGGCELGNEQMCFDAIHYRSLGGLKVPPQPWQNRPTYQQAVQVGAK